MNKMRLSGEKMEDITVMEKILHHGVEEATWEHESEVCAKYLDLFN